MGKLHKYIVFVLCGLMFCQYSQAQIYLSVNSDSLALNTRTFCQGMDKLRTSRAFNMTHVAIPVIAVGMIFKSEDGDFRSLRNKYMPSFRHHYDDYLQNAPAVAMNGMKTFGVEGRSSWGRMLVSDAFSALILTAAVNGVKYTANVMRPDGTSRNSFPSGHTATAFMTATMLHKEYGLTRSPWYSVAGYTAATVTGLSRIMNNRHWMSDVMVGAGIGILSTELGYYFADLIFKDKGLLRNYLPSRQFGRDYKPSFFGLYLGFDVMPGRYALKNGARITLSHGGNAGIEGAWFMNPYLGFGGRFTASSLQISLDGKSQDEYLGIYSTSAGVYFSYPVFCRLLAGSKLIAGYDYTLKNRLQYSDMQSNNNKTTITTGGKGGFNIGTGLSFTYIATDNLGLKLFSDYTLSSSPFERGGRMGHRFTFGGGANILF